MSIQANAQESYSIGIGLGYEQKPYSGDHSNWIPVPHFEYQNGNLFIKGLKAGLYLFNTPTTKFDAHLRYESLNFKPSDSYGALQHLNRRKSTIELGIGFQHIFPNKIFISADIDADILGRSDGFNIDTGIGMIHPINDHFKIIPKIGGIWSSKDHNDYYYGVSNAESYRTGISYYSPSSSFTPYIGVGTTINATDNLHIFGGAQFKFLPSKVKNSPMTDRSTLSNFAIGINYNF
ncbi:MipA/OmpV family protein [Wohlfahrtiimonas larvae]|uniref:MipA/OmpV family protein n=1 Tax=Wohlfahrtiimonas larvae TaxID=1157986 RepID=A0ABP9MV66_9GAMM|nr:MipA/OmpV family protein [Wohlfahrtiimonas larvae]